MILDYLFEYLEYFFMPFLLYFGYVTAFGDLKTGKISNRLIAMGIKAGIAWHAVYILFIAWFATARGIPLFPDAGRVILDYSAQVAANTATALAVGFFMWWVHMWAAGDAKLFAVFAFIIPIDFYMNFKIRYFQSFVLLFNIFIIALIVVVADFAYKLIIRFIQGRRSGEIRDYIDNYISRKKIRDYIAERRGPAARLVMGLIFSFLITSLIRKNLNIAVEKLIPWKFTLQLHSVEINESILFLLFVLLFKPLSRLYQNRLFYYTTVITISGYIIFYLLFNKSLAIMTDIAHFGGLSILVITFRRIYDFYSERINVFTIPMSDLQANMILSKSTVKTLQNDHSDFYKKYFDIVYADGITQDQITALKQLKEIVSVEVSGTIPFAPCIFGGVITLIVLKGLIFGSLIGL